MQKLEALCSNYVPLHSLLASGHYTILVSKIYQFNICGAGTLHTNLRQFVKGRLVLAMTVTVSDWIRFRTGAG